MSQPFKTFFLLLLAFLSPTIAFAHDFEVDGIYFNINGNEATVTYQGTSFDQYNNEYSGNVTIPTTVTYGGTIYSVTTINEYTFYYCTGLTSVNIPNSVTTIGEQAFHGCSGLTDINIPNSITSIGNGAFAFCSGLTDINIPNTITAIGEYTFYYCTGLTSVNIPNSVTTIGEQAFGDCSVLTSINIPNSVNTIGFCAFLSTNLKSVNIPNSVTSIGNGAFANCSGLTSIIVDSANSTYDSRYNCNAIIETASNILIAGCMNSAIPNDISAIGEAAFVGCNGLTYITIPNSVTTIGVAAFSGCGGLTNVTIPNSVTTICDYAFNECLQLSHVTCFATTPPSISSSSFGNYNAGLYVPRNCKNVYQSADYWNLFSMIHEISYDMEINGIYYAITGLNTVAVTYKDLNYNSYSGTVTIPDSVSYYGVTYQVTSIDNQAFQDCSGLTSVTIPNSVTAIGKRAFIGCHSLTSAIIPNTVTSIGEGAFFDCIELNSIILPNSINAINNDVFGSCANLTNITIPNSVKTIGANAFACCSTLSRINIPDSVTTIGDHAFYACYGLTDVTIGCSVSSIFSQAFYDCTGIKNLTWNARNCEYRVDNDWPEMPIIQNVVIGDKVEIIPNYFLIGAEITSLTIPNSVKSIGHDAFAACDGLTSVNIPNSVTSIGNYAFCACDALSTIIIPNSISNIGDWAFSYCSRLTSIDIPNSVTHIGDGAFANCEGLTSIEIPYSVSHIGNGAFANCSGLTSIIVDSDNLTYDSHNNCNAIIETNSNTLIVGCMNTVIPNTVTSIGEAAFTGRSNLKIITIPNSVTTIGISAFSGCKELTSITIPNSVITIGDYAFWGCTGLNSVTCLANIPPTINSNSFSSDVTNRATLYVPFNSLNVYQNAESWKNFYRIVGIPLIDDFDVNGIYYHPLTDKTVMVIPKTGEQSYYYGNVVIPDSVSYQDFTFKLIGIDANAFDGCDELTSVVIGNAVETIGEEAFQGCTGLTSVTIGSSVTSIGERAFNYCNALQTVKCLGTVPPTMASSNCFSSAAYRKATLKVPRNYAEDYIATDYWYKFEHIEGYGSAGLGDVNGDGITNIADITALIDRLLNSDADDEFYFESADFNFNGRLDIGDVTTLIDTMLTGSK